MLPTVITLFVNSDGTTRVSRVTAHGEEVIQPNVEVAEICAHLYRRLAGGDFTGSGETERLKDALVAAANSLEAATAASQRPLAHLSSVVQELRAMKGRLDELERYLRVNTINPNTLKGWIDEVYLRHPVIVREIQGQ